jgi:hypothetical protein
MTILWIPKEVVGSADYQETGGALPSLGDTYNSGVCSAMS